LKQETKEREQIERQLRSKELRLTQLTESIREVFWITTPGVREWVYVSPAYEEIFGRSCASLYEDPDSFLEVIQPEDRRRIVAIMKKKIEGDFGFDFRIKRSNGETRWVRARAFPIKDEKGETYRVAGISEDVTEQKSAEWSLRRTEIRNRALLSAIPDLMFRVNRNGVFLDYHVKDISQLQMAPEEFLGNRIWDLFPALKEPVSRAIQRALDANTLQVIEYPFLLHGMSRDFEARFSKSGDEEVVVIIRDITERKRLEREILEISSREQQRIGHDLHDGLSQQLAGIALLGKVLHQRLETQSRSESADARRIVDLANDAIAQSRRLARGLSPVQLERQGLAAALEELAMGVEHLYPTSCRFRCSEEFFVDDHTVADHIYRIAQEAVNNALKHAHSKHIDIELSHHGDQLTLKVIDDGRGLPETAARGSGMGFNIMEYRARMIDASLSISGTPGKGTSVICKYVNKHEQK
jgi:PAS domain S-box-containing protein